MHEFTYSPSKWLPFRDKAVLDRVRNIKREDIDKHPNPDFKICVVPDSHIEHIFLTDIFYRIKTAADAGENVVLILPNPCSAYAKLAHSINTFRVDCRGLHVFAMDEYADEDGNTAPESWPQGFMHALKKHLYCNIDQDLRPPEGQIKAPQTEIIDDYGRMIADMGGADACYSGSGWAGHIAFIDPDTDEFAGTLEEWKQMGPRIVTLSPFTIAQNSLHGSFGMSGDMGMVPPRAATIGPAEVIGSKYRMDMNALTVDGTSISWQRMTTRLVAHGPVTPQLPTSILQTLPTDFYISETSAQDIEPIWDKEY